MSDKPESTEPTEKKVNLTLVKPYLPLKEDTLELTDEERLRYGLQHLDQALMFCMELKSVKGQELADRIYNAFILGEKLQVVHYL